MEAPIGPCETYTVVVDRDGRVISPEHLRHRGVRLTEPQTYGHSYNPIAIEALQQQPAAQVETAA